MHMFLNWPSPCLCGFSPQGSAIRGPQSGLWSGDTKRWFRSELGFRLTGRWLNLEESQPELNEEEPKVSAEQKELLLCWELRGVCLQRATGPPHCLLQHIETYPQLHPVCPPRLVTQLLVFTFMFVYFVWQMSKSFLLSDNRNRKVCKWDQEDCEHTVKHKGRRGQNGGLMSRLPPSLFSFSLSLTHTH